MNNDIPIAPDRSVVNLKDRSVAEDRGANRDRKLGRHRQPYPPYQGDGTWGTAHVRAYEAGALRQTTAILDKHERTGSTSRP